MTEKPDQPRLVVVAWQDSRQPTAAWRFLSAVEDPAPVQCVTAGWLVSENDQAIAIATSLGDVHDPDGIQANGITQIVRACITNITDLAPEPRTPASPEEAP